MQLSTFEKEEKTYLSCISIVNDVDVFALGKIIVGHKFWLFI